MLLCNGTNESDTVLGIILAGLDWLDVFDKNVSDVEGLKKELILPIKSHHLKSF